MEIYPRSFPQPQLTPYMVDVDVGVLRTPMDGGLARQRRLYDVMPHRFDLMFVVPVPQLFAWQDWINRYAYDFIQMDLLSWLSAGKACSPHFVRFTSNLRLETMDRGYLRCMVNAELSPAQVSNYMPPPEDNWIIAGIPDVPSINTVTGGAPGSPPPNTVIAGNPANPSL